jgi:hypothetical protein
MALNIDISDPGFQIIEQAKQNFLHINYEKI